MRIRSGGTVVRFLLLVLLLTGFEESTIRAQNGSRNQDDVSSFVQSVAKTVYNLAWPTATYKSVSLEKIRPAENGFDIIITLSGLSAFDDSDLWLRLALMIRHGEFSDIRVIDDNHILVPPFATTNALAQAIKATAEDYAAHQQGSAAPAPATTTAPTTLTPGPPQPAFPAEGVCLSNSTGVAINFQYRWGQGPWKTMDAAPDRDVELWWNLDPGQTASPELSIRYDDDFADGYTERSYVLPRKPTTVPVNCDRVAGYHFAMNGPKIEIYQDSH